MSCPSQNDVAFFRSATCVWGVCAGRICLDSSLAMQVDILIVNCSLFNPTPSLSAMIVNHFKMKSNIVSYNLSGMGCSAGVISISLARELLQVIIIAATHFASHAELASSPSFQVAAYKYKHFCI